ncbi:MAG: hypothetical protein BWK80_52285 [Desulfobacteraceae bacterium IS3]|nr:MAG: hypothetical protein BWK80_52285 [Desulfobacteraceae bacterium IS3]
MTFGLLDGWWLFEDKENRIQGSPLLTPEKWKEILEKQGFGAVFSIAHDSEPEHLIIAESSAVSVSEQHLVPVFLAEISPDAAANENEITLIPLSTKSEKNLLLYAQQLKTFLEKKCRQGNAPSLADIAFTLQVGREAMPFRLAFAVKTTDELIAKIDRLLSMSATEELFGDRAEILPGVFAGKVPLQKKEKGMDRSYLFDIVKKGMINRLAELWVHGADADWNLLIPGDAAARRVPLPTYPFLKERYWIGSDSAESPVIASETVLPPKPLLNDSAVSPEKEQMSQVVNRIRNIASKILGFSPSELPPAEMGFFDMGMESVQILEFGAQVSENFKVELYPTALFDYPTIADISRYIMEQVAGGREQVSPATCNLQPATLYYRSEWEASEAAGMRKARTESLITYHSSLLTFLVFASDNNVSEALKERLQSQAGAHVSLILVKPGKSWQNIGDNTYQIRPERPEDYQRLLQELIIREQIPSGIVHLWSEERFHEIGARLETGLEMSIYSVFYLTQALMAQKIRHRIRLLYVYQEDKDKPCPLYAAVSGFARTVRLENPNFAWKTIAMGGQGSGVRGQGNISSYLSPLTSDLLTDSDDEIAVLYYAGKRWVSRLRQFDPEIAPDKKLLLKAGGVYLITGGAGGIGMIFASYLAEKAEKAKIILTGRSELSHEKKAEIERLASFGAEAVYIRTDISDKKAVNRLISEIRSRYGEINGVIHAAGLLRDNFVIKKTAEEFEAVLGPKVYGTLYLDEALKDEELDFFVMFSSLTASVGNPGQSDYAYSNSFMDSFAASREQLCRQNQRKGKTVSIIWPYWRQGGMRIDENTEKLMTEKRGLIPIEKEDGFRTFEIALLSDTLQVGILKGDVRKAAEVLGVRPLSPEERGRIVTSHPKPLTPNPKPIALIGMACRFPGDCSSPEKFWRLLQEGRHCVTAIPPERWNADDFYDPDPNVSGKSYVREAAFLQEDVGNFDARFFGMSPREAADTDPQQRLLLETAYQALERAGQSHKGLRGSQTGVFVGIIGSEYSKIQKQGPYKATGCVSSVASGRIAHVLGLQGPALSIDTACSSSLVSVHLACESLRRRECDMALAGGVSLMLSPDTFADLCALKALSKDGKCKAFDADGDGYGRGEGCGMVVLKRLEDARKDGDPILAVIRGSAVNHDGSASGLTVPNGAAQEKLLRKALENAGVTPDEISYIETHGTGTSLGDPIEMRAISQVFGNGHSRNAHPLIVGSVKANIGHLEAAAGIAGLIKTVLCLNHREIPPQLHIKKINPKMAHETIPALIPQSRINWNTNGKARIAGVSSFGFSGTNAHVIVSEERFEVRGSGSEETPLTADPAPRTPHLLTLSAMDENALKTLASDYKFFLDEHSEIAITDVCYTANAARAHFACRAAFIAEDAKEMSAALQKFRFAHFCTPEENGISDAVGVSPRAYPAEKILDLPRTDSPEQWKTLLETLAEQYCRGDEIDWEGFYAPLTARRKVILPTYPFQRRRYWGEGERSEVRGQGSEASPNLEPRTSNPSSLDYSLNTDCLPEIKDNLGVLHVGYYQEMLCKAVKTLYHTAAYTLKEMEYLIALYAPDNVSKILHLNLIPAEESAQNGEVEFRFYSSDAATSDAKQKAGLLNARGRLTLNEHCMLPIMSLPEIADIQKRCQKQMSGFSFYQKMKEERGMDLGQSVRQIEHIWCRAGAVQIR